MTNLVSNKRRASRVLAVGCLGVSCVFSTVSAQIVLSNLGTIDGGADSIAWALSADGNVVVGTSSIVSGPFAEQYGFRWTQANEMQRLGGFSGSGSARAHCVSGDGSVVAGWALVGGDQQACRWSAPSWNVEFLPPLPATDRSSADAISRNGSLIVGTQGSYAFRWTSEDGLSAIPGLSPIGSAANGISGNGQVITGLMSVGGLSHAFRLESGSNAQDLYPFSDPFSRGGTAISFDGSVIVGGQSFRGGAGSFRWTSSSGMVTLPINDVRALSDDGAVALGSNRGPMGSQVAMLWTAQSGSVTLASYLGSLGVDLTGWILESAVGVSADGTVVVGTGTYFGSRRAFLVSGLSLTSTPCACPADFDGSGGTPDSTDIASYFAAWLLGEATADADCSGGTPDSTDIDVFFTQWLAGGC